MSCVHLADLIWQPMFIDTQRNPTLQFYHTFFFFIKTNPILWFSSDNRFQQWYSHVLEVHCWSWRLFKSTKGNTCVSLERILLFPYQCFTQMSKLGALVPYIHRRHKLIQSSAFSSFHQWEPGSYPRNKPCIIQEPTSQTGTQLNKLEYPS